MKFKDKIQTSDDFNRMAQERRRGTKTASAPSGNKFGAVPSVVDGRWQDSGHESSWAGRLLQLQIGGYIKDLRLDKMDLKYALDVNETRICDYEADARFTVVRAFELPTLHGSVAMVPGQTYIIDAKSAKTRKLPVFSIKRKLMWAIYQHRILEV